MSEDNKNNIFSKRTNQFSSLKNKNKETSDFVESSFEEEKDFIEKENVLKDIADENNLLDENVSFDDSNEDESAPKSLLDQYLDDDSSYNNVTVEDNDYNTSEEPMFEDFEESDEIQISIEDDEDEDNSDDLMMTSILEEVDEELTKQNPSSSFEPNITESSEESFLTEEEPNPFVQEGLTMLENEEDENEINTSDEFDDFYTKDELDAKIKKGANTKDLAIKIGVGVGAIIIIIILALIISSILNKKPNNTNTVTTEKNPTESIVTVTPPPTTTTNSIVDDIISSMTSNTIEEVPNESTNIVEEPEEDSFIKNYKGYVVDLKEDSIILSSLSYDKYLFLIDVFEEYMAKDPEEVSVRADEKNKKYHEVQCECELPKETAIISLKEALDNEYVAESCAEKVGIDETKDPRNFDYEEYPELRGILFKKIAITRDSNISIANLTIGIEATATYFQDSESYLNELIELKPVKAVDIKPEGDNKTEDTEAPVEDKEVNVWGEEWNEIVGTINDRREDENKQNQNIGNSSGTIELGKTEKYESVSTSINIGKASIVWFQITWKSNAEVSSVPDAEDIIVEILTPNGTLINDENIDKYGKIWVDPATGQVNVVIRNTQAGDYEIVFTKTVGTYLGDVSIKAIPITGFLELKNAAAVYTDGRLEVIWNAIGVKDDNCLVEVYAVNGKKKILLYSANSIDDGIHTVDMASIKVSKIAGNTYDIIIKVTDIEVSASKPYTIVAKYLSDSITIPNVEIPEAY